MCHCRVKSVLDMTCNILDGVIVLLNNVASTRAHYGRTEPGDRPVQPSWNDMCILIHSQWKEVHAIQTSVTGTVGSTPTLPRANLWASPKNRNYPYAIQGPVWMGSEWSDWLNYVVVSSVKDRLSLAAILRCLRSRRGRPAEIPSWEGRQTFQLGHWWAPSIPKFMCRH